jgi:hypothetical protein
MSNPAKIFCSPGPAIKTNQRRAKPLAVPNATRKISLQRSDHQLTLNNVEIGRWTGHMLIRLDMRVAELWRYPVKSLAGERPDETELTAS